MQISPYLTELATDLLHTSPSKLAVAMRFGTPKATQSMSSEWACSYVQNIDKVWLGYAWHLHLHKLYATHLSFAGDLKRKRHSQWLCSKPQWASGYGEYDYCRDPVEYIYRVITKQAQLCKLSNLISNWPRTTFCTHRKEAYSPIPPNCKDVPATKHSYTSASA